MRIGVDYFPATSHGPGVGRYARELVRALAALQRDASAPACDLRLFELGRGARTVPAAGLGLECAHVRRRRARLPRRILRPLARLGVGADTLLGGVDLFHHVLADPPPVARALQTLAVSELPDPRGPAGSRFARALERMDALLTFSAHAADELTRSFGFEPARLVQVPVGCEHFARDAPPGLAPADPPELVVLGALDERRAPHAVLAAFEALRAGGVEARLRFLGRSGAQAASFAAAVERSPQRAHVEWQIDPAEPDLPRALGRATALVHLSRAEATAVTPLEAFAFGLPVVASPLPALREALGDEAIYAEIEDGPGLAAAMAAALAGAAEPARRAARLAKAGANSWERNARATLAAWSLLLDRPAAALERRTSGPDLPRKRS